MSIQVLPQNHQKKKLNTAEPRLSEFLDYCRSNIEAKITEC